MSRCKRKELFLTFAVVAALIATPAFAATSTWINVTTNGTWSTAGNWNPAAPATTGVDDVVFGSNTSGITRLVSTVNSGWSTNGTVNNITFTGNGTNSWLLLADTGVKLNIAGGITNASTATVLPKINGSLNFTASQTIDVGTIGMNTDAGTWTSASGAILNITGTLAGGQIKEFQFYAGTTTAASFLGSVKQTGSVGIRFDNVTQYSRLGVNALSVDVSGNATSQLSFTNFTSQAAGTFANAINFSGFGNATSSGNYKIMGPASASPFAITLSGNMSGDIGAGSDSAGKSGLRFTSSGANNNTNLRFLLTGDNSGLISSLASKDTGMFPIQVLRGMVIVDSDNALGAGNGLLVGLGSGSTVISNVAGLLAANGRTISSDIRVFKNTNATPVSQSLILGVDGTGSSATFAGNIFLDSSATAAQVPTLQLTAGAGSTVTFNGTIQNQGAALANVVPVTINGGGIVSLNGANTYTGPTTVAAGTTLRGTGSLTSSLTVNGILAPGNSIGTLIVGNTTFGSGSSFAVELGAGASDLLQVNGNLDISLATLNLSGTADNVTSYTIATYTGSLAGTFTSIVGMPGGYTLDYGTGSNSAIMLMVPEPGTWALLAFSLTTVMILRRRSTMPDRRNGA